MVMLFSFLACIFFAGFSVYAEIEVQCHNASTEMDGLTVYHSDSGKVVLSWDTSYEMWPDQEALQYQVCVFHANYDFNSFFVNPENFYVVDPIYVDPIRSECLGSAAEGVIRDEQTDPLRQFVVIDLLGLLGNEPPFPGYLGHQGARFLDPLTSEEELVLWFAVRPAYHALENPEETVPVLDETGRQKVSSQGNPVVEPLEDYDFSAHRFSVLLPVVIRLNLNEGVPEKLRLLPLEPQFDSSQYVF